MLESSYRPFFIIMADQNDAVFVTVLAPMHSPRARGIYASGNLGDNVRVRMSLEDRKLIERHANTRGMSKAEFMRWCAVNVAKELDKLAK